MKKQKNYNPSISYGIVDSYTVDTNDPAQLIKSADILMYKYKNSKKESINKKS